MEALITRGRAPMFVLVFEEELLALK